MNTAQISPEVTEDVFKALLLIYVSHSDLEFSKVEKDHIIASFGKENYDSANILFSNFREYRLLEKLCDLRNLYFPGPEGKNVVLNMVKGHYNVDGDFSKLEKTQYNFLRMVL